MRIGLAGLLLACTASSALFAETPPPEQTNKWYLRGPDGGYVVRVAIDPVNHAPLAGGESGMFRYNATAASPTWEYQSGGLNDGPFIGDIATTSSASLVINDSRVALSTDGGTTWNYKGTAAMDYYVSSLAASAASASRAYAAVNYGNGDIRGGLYISNDGGVTWQQSAATAGENLTLVRTSPMNPDLVYIATDVVGGVASLYRSIDGGVSFGLGPVMQTSGGVQFADVAQDPIGAFHTIAVVTSDSHLFVSSNLDPTLIDQGPQFPGNPHAVLFDNAAIDVMYFATSRGVYRLSGIGTTAVEASNGMLLMGPTVGGAQYHDEVFSLAQASGGTLYAASSSGGLYSSVDGQNWNTFNTGFSGQNFRTIAFQPGWVSPNPQVVLAGSSDSSNLGILYRSIDGGKTWAPLSSSGINSGALRGIGFSPANPNIVLASGFSQYLSTGGAGEYNMSLWRSTDAGLTWTIAPNNVGLHFDNRRNILFDPDDVGGQRVLVSGGTGLSISTDAGQTWVNSQDNSGLFGGLPYACGAGMVGLTAGPGPISGTRFYASFFDGGQPDCPGANLGNVYISDDGGYHWTYSSTGLPTRPDDTTLQFAKSATPGTLFVTKVTFTGGNGGIYKSTDYGASWTDSSNGLISKNMFTAVADPIDPNVVWAASAYISSSSPGGIFRSNDGGVKWNLYSNGLRNPAIYWLTIDPADPNHLLAGGFDGIYEMHYAPDTDQDGIPDSLENTVVPNGDANNDGISDATQANVASVGAAPTSASIRASVPMLDTSGYIVVELDRTPGTFTGDCQFVSNLEVVPTNQIPLSNRMIQAGSTIRFVLPNCTQATVKIRYSALTSYAANGVFGSYSPNVPGDPTTVRWGMFPAGQTSGHASVDPAGTWSIVLDQNGYGNVYAQNSGSILFQGAPGRDSIFGGGFE